MKAVTKVLGKCTPVAYKNPGLNIKKYRINQKSGLKIAPEMTGIFARYLYLIL